MNNLFQELADRFKTGTVNIAVQMDKGTMAVMVTFKGIDCAPRVLKGSPSEIDDQFILSLESVLEIASEINEHNVLKELQAIREKQLAADNKKEADAKKAEDEKKKEVKKQAQEAQTSLLDVPAPIEKKDIDPVPESEPVAEKEEETEEAEAVDFGDKGEKDSSLKIPFRISSKDRVIIMNRLLAEVKEVWDVHPLGTKVIIELKNCTQEEAEEAFRRSGIAMEYLKLPKEDNVSESVPSEDEKHAKNVEAMKSEMNKAGDDFDIDDDFDVSDGEPVNSVEDDFDLEDDDFEL